MSYIILRRLQEDAKNSFTTLKDNALNVHAAVMTADRA